MERRFPAEGAGALHLPLTDAAMHVPAGSRMGGANAKGGKRLQVHILPAYSVRCCTARGYAGDRHRRTS